MKLTPKYGMYIAIGVAVVLGLALRLYRISANEFLFYDEGMYLGQNRAFLDLVAANPPRNIQELFIILGLMFKTALATPKALWFFILNLRVFFNGVEAWYYARLLSAFAGLATVALTYFWAKRYYGSSTKALLSALILLVHPSHVFYSRLGMQESLSALLFLAATYLYVFSGRGVSPRSCGAAVLLTGVFFTNYRMIIAPIFLVLAQMVQEKASWNGRDARKLVWALIIFGAIVVGVGALYAGANSAVTFGWIFHQAQEAHAHRHWMNFFSFPYYFFALDHLLFGLFLFANFYFLSKGHWRRQLPFIMVLTQMFIFSFAAEKGARYLCVVLPFSAMAVADAIVRFHDDFPKRPQVWRIATVLLLIGLISQSFMISKARTNYHQAVGLVLAHDPAAKIISTQPLVESLFVGDEQKVVVLPKDSAALAVLLSQGYRYLILDPQAYISWTADGNRFTSPMIPLLELVCARLAPVAVLPHLDQTLLRRFVLDHNQDLWISLKFLNDAKDKGNIYIYDVRAP